ncbi:CTP synthase [Candidatus Pelagibacter sp.]|jgi:CTP synthase|nr:CTP synthase [Candidatus Pelagibacter bacterium]MDB9808184.1 CTP synthase [Candidatus Pelagibacter sp.]MDC0364223.1 CTP synthase [Candidatus Pelagibacter sp.]|tara:strand:+ start:1 stop:1617 length:1617 start_codon:yes stop_codon:yes gene_type:complete
MARYIFVTGGVVSSLGKGLSSASLAYLLQSRGFKVRLRKLDPYLNVDPGTMSPFQHGEVFVTDDGAETDLDLGHYERFSGIASKKSDNITTGKIYSDVLKKERKGGYLGKTVQVIPHITDRIKEFIKNDTSKEDFIICEIGGIVGDIESLPFVEAIRQFSNDIGKRNALFIHLTLVPYLKASDEIKTKPTQHSVKELRSLGIQPDIIICRSERVIPLEHRKKISLFCNVDIKNVIQTVDVKTIYEAPISFNRENLDTQVLDYFKIKSKKKVNLNPWKKITKIVLNTKKSIDIAIIGKYVDLKDAYKSLDEALTHGGVSNNLKVNLVRIDSEKLKVSEIKKRLKGVSGILIPGGFGKRGTEGKIASIKYARQNKVPFFGICFGMQMAIIEFARNKLNIKKATSSEFGKGGVPIIGLITEWRKDGKVIKGTDKNLGGTMRLGLYDAKLRDNSLIKEIYKSNLIKERHRHRYEVNIAYKDKFENKGMMFSGLSPDNKLPEIIELKNHPWFVAVQFHPEFKSRPLDPHPLFSSFIKAAKNHR